MAVPTFTLHLSVASACFWSMLAAVALTRPSGVAAESVLLDFEGVGDYEEVGDYYGSYDGGPRYGVGFVGSYAAINGGLTTVTVDEPSPSTVAGFYTEDSEHYLTTQTGFTGLSFYYVSVETVTVTVYDGPDKTGNVLASVTLPATDPDEFEALFGWRFFALPFAGVAKSAAFSDSYTFYDNMRIDLFEPPPTTVAPTKPPTKAPSKPPTKAPTKAPTKTPTKPPSKAPTSAPNRPCTGNTYWIWNPTTDTLVGELKNNTGQCIAFPYNLEARPCSGPRTLPVTMVLKNSAQVKIRTQKEYVGPFFFWGDDPVKGDVFRSTSRLAAGTYWLYTTIDGKEERIRFTQTC
jgi:hypothetical protein